MLTERGARVTRDRVRILAELLLADEALTHHELQRRLGYGESVDRVTIYRVLDWLTTQGLAHKHPGDDRVGRFSVAGHSSHGRPAHAHFQCTECGKVVCLAELRQLQFTLPDGYRRRDVDVTVRGHCDRCVG